ncbi:vacuolar protein 8 isoform X2 [Eutrema salsugineum]|uniref:vacuolar protein 8 isoform X2 n=1 Tax=Eutrema salsugineum TaxID=72664 RepID=UPI000CED6598|nr:vacuolar protein 8 isoform X2 [Eutrema salsugineum]
MGKQSEEESRPSIERAIESISCLISLSHSIKSFSVKWQLIRSKLEELYSGISAVENLDSGFDPSLSSLVKAILVSLKECHDLASRCLNVSYVGKLLMQSDLDVIAGKLDRHVRNLSMIYSAGILSHGFAIVVSKPSGKACRDDMRFYVRDLLTRMKIGDVEMKRQALVKLNESMEEDDRVLENGNVVGREASARCLMELTDNSENAWSVSAHGGVAALLKICSCGEFGGELIASSCGVLRNLVGVEEIKRYMIEEDMVSTFIKLIGSKDEIVQVNSIELLTSLCSRDEQSREILVREGGIQELVLVADPNSVSSSKAKEMALRAIHNLCFGSVSYLNTLMSSQFLVHLLYLLRNGEFIVQESALKVTSRLCSLPMEVKRIMGDAGFMPELVRFLDAKSLHVREIASDALCCLISVPKNRKKFLQDDGNISYILQLLDEEEMRNEKNDLGGTKFLISILMLLTSCNRVRRKISASGYLKSIAEKEDSDAKRLVKKLSKNRLRTILGGIWHS